MLFMILAKDKEGGSAIRAATRDAHLGYLKDAGERLKLAGPIRDDDEKPVGSMLIIDAASETAARLFSKHDPYTQAGLFKSVEIHSFKAVTGDWPKLEDA